MQESGHAVVLLVAAGRPHRVVVLAVAPVIGYDLTIPPQVLGAARDADGSPLYDVAVVTLDGQPVAATRGYAIAPSAGPEALARAQTVIVPGTQVAGPRRDGTIDDDLRAALASVPADARWVSICTGAFVLAAAGILDGHRATTHWKYADDFRRLYPDIAVDEDVLFTDDGRVLTSAGLSAGIDLCLHLVRSDHGTAVANAVARHMVVPPWRDGGQAQFIERHVPRRADETTGDVRAWAQAHLDRPLDVATLARRASMSVRTFTRRFREETGQSPGAVGHPAAGRARPSSLLERRPAPSTRSPRAPGGHRRLAAPAPARATRRLALGVPA